MDMKDLDTMTTRQVAAALKKHHGVTVTSCLQQWGMPDSWEVQFSDNEILQVTNSNMCPEWDTKSACETEARQLARLERLVYEINKGA